MSEQSAEYKALPRVTANTFYATSSKVTKMVFMIVLAMMISTTARAEWTLIKGGNNDHRLYIDFATIRIKGTHVKAWSLVDLTTMQTGDPSFLSSKAQIEFDCSEEQSALLSFVWYSGNMGEGEVVASQTRASPMFKPVVPDTINYAEMKTVCDSLNQRK